MSEEPENLNSYLNSLPGISYRSHEFVDWVDPNAEAIDPKDAYESNNYEEWKGFDTKKTSNKK